MVAVLSTKLCGCEKLRDQVSSNLVPVRFRCSEIVQCERGHGPCATGPPRSWRDSTGSHAASRAFTCCRSSIELLVPVEAGTLSLSGGCQSFTQCETKSLSDHVALVCSTFTPSSPVQASLQLDAQCDQTRIQISRHDHTHFIRAAYPRFRDRARAFRLPVLPVATRQMGSAAIQACSMTLLKPRTAAA